MVEPFPMNSGNTTHSYSNNSQNQKKASELFNQIIRDAIMEKLESISTPFRIADFGCSVGPNTFHAVQNLIEAVHHKSTDLQIQFQVFFNDLASNDFNALFASLPPHREYYAAAAPGSFHGRIFPSASINVACSYHALPWLSKEPEGLSSSAWNEGRIHYTMSSEAVVDAYRRQFERDMGLFVSARAEEIIPGGIMILIIPGLVEGVSLSHLLPGVVNEFLCSTLMDMVNQGEVDKCEVDRFNLPVYFPRIGEVKKVIEENGCFSIERIETRYNPAKVNAENSLMHTRAATEPTFTTHFGTQIVQKMFQNAFANIATLSKLLHSLPPSLAQFFLFLKLK